MLFPCSPPNTTYIEYLDYLQFQHFPSPTRPAFPKVSSAYLDLEHLEPSVTSLFESSVDSSEHCRQYEHELYKCQWISIRDVTDAIMAADDHVTLVTVASWDGVKHFMELLDYWRGGYIERWTTHKTDSY